MKNKEARIFIIEKVNDNNKLVVNSYGAPTNVVDIRSFQDSVQTIVTIYNSFSLERRYIKLAEDVADIRKELDALELSNKDDVKEELEALRVELREKTRACDICAEAIKTSNGKLLNIYKTVYSNKEAAARANRLLAEKAAEKAKAKAAEAKTEEEKAEAKKAEAEAQEAAAEAKKKEEEATRERKAAEAKKQYTEAEQAVLFDRLKGIPKLCKIVSYCLYPECRKDEKDNIIMLGKDSGAVDILKAIEKDSPEEVKEKLTNTAQALLTMSPEDPYYKAYKNHRAKVTIKQAEELCDMCHGRSQKRRWNKKRINSKKLKDLELLVQCYFMVLERTFDFANEEAKKGKTITDMI